jgi:hypothetical protein
MIPTCWPPCTGWSTRRRAGIPRDGSDHREPDRGDDHQDRPDGAGGLDEKAYETGIKVSDEELARVRCTREKFHGEWNYTIRPRGSGR